MGYYIILLAYLSLCDSTLLWRVNVNPPAYLLGTAHLPNNVIWSSLSETAKSAFYNSTHFLPEFDMTNFFSFTRFRMCMNSLSSTNVKLPPPPDKQASSILDIYLILEARRLQKTVMALETADMYCEFTKFQLDSLLTNFTSNTQNNSPLSNENEYEHVKHIYNCDLNYPGELFPPAPMFMIDKSSLTLQQRLEEIVERRDGKMAQVIDGLLREGSPDKRYFIAAGFIHLMGSDGIVTKLRQDYKYSVTRLCTDEPNFRTAMGCAGPSWCDHPAGF